jgi:hypothetical protein
MNEQDTADDIIHWIKVDYKCLYMVSTIKEQIKDLSKEKYEFWDRVHKLIYNHFIKSN